MENMSDMEMVETPGAKQQVIQTAKERAQHVKTTVTEETTRAVENIKSAAMETVERQKSELAESLRSVDQALRKTTAGMENSALAPQVEKVADAISQAHQFIEHHGIEDLGVALRRLSLQHPAVFYSGLFAIGFAAGRFLSASEQHAMSQPELDTNLLDATPDVDVDNQPEPSQVVSHHGPY
jgi:hypothetical protein